MAINRVFLNWDQPGLAAAVDHLARHFGSPGELDLAGVIVAVPGGRAGRRLLEILVQQSEQQDRVLTPPRIVTAGQLPELLYETRKPFAGDLSQHLAWAGALKGSKPELLQRLAPVPPADDDLAAWLALAEIVARLHRELAADALDFSAVAACGRKLTVFGNQSVGRPWPPSSKNIFVPWTDLTCGTYRLRGCTRFGKRNAGRNFKSFLSAPST